MAVQVIKVPFQYSPTQNHPEVTIMVPAPAAVKDVGRRVGGLWYIYVLGDAAAPFNVPVTLYVHETGTDVHANIGEYVGTVEHLNHWYHVFLENQG